VVLVPAAAASLVSGWPLAPVNSWVHLILQGMAWLCFVAGAAFRFWATLFVGGHKEHDLVTTGPYSLCRHPLYLGSLLLGVSGSCFVEGPLLLAGVAVVAGVYLWATIPVEEAALRARHGSRYDLYVREVPRVLPRAWKTQTPQEVIVDTHSLWLECARASRWVWLPILGPLARYLRVFEWWPHSSRPF